MREFSSSKERFLVFFTFLYFYMLRGCGGKHGVVLWPFISGGRVICKLDKGQ